ncbi:MAG: DUF1492 domain-containing protein [Lachnospiraceae bacterium]|nr:DUF1492 domain-containing protein [Lachnospiraceae bacterium]MCM1373301.1 DUF1492 domain-containing protein [Bacteroides sp.]
MEKLTREELIKREKAVIDKICSDDKYAYGFFHEKCRPLISNILWTIFGNNGDYDELVNELYLHLKKPNKEGELWHSLKTFDYRTSLFDWIKTIAIRHFYKPVDERFELPEAYVESGLAESMFAELERAECRKYMHFKYIKCLDDVAISEKLQVELSQLQSIRRKSIRLLKKTIQNKFPEYLDYMFIKNETSEISIDDASVSLGEETVSTEQIDAFRYLSAMPDELYRRVLYSIFIEDKEPEVVAAEMNRKVSNIYNLKSRGLEQLRDVALFSNEIQNLEQYINLIADDKKKQILRSIFIDKMSYDDVCSMLNLNESQFKKLKKEALKEIKTKIFKAKS